MIIKNGEVFQEDGSFRLQDLYVENHRIVASEDEVTDKTIVDAAGLRVLPGLVDIHSHGAFGHDFSDADPEGLKIILKYEKSHGITSYCPTSMTLPVTLYTAPSPSAKPSPPTATLSLVSGFPSYVLLSVALVRVTSRLEIFRVPSTILKVTLAKLWLMLLKSDGFSSML